MQKRLFFNRIQIYYAGISIDQAVALAPCILADPAKAPFALRNTAHVGAQIALYVTIV